MDHISYPRFTAGTTQQKLNGQLLISGSTAVQSDQDLILCILGDDNFFDANFREELQRFLRYERGHIVFTGIQGLGTVSGGTVNRRIIRDWRHDGFDEVRLSRTYNATVNVTTNIFTSVGHGLSLSFPLIFTTIPAGITNISTNTLYYARDITTDTFKISTVQGGSAIDIGGTNDTVGVGAGLVELWPGIVALHDQTPHLIIVKCGANDILAGATAAICLSRLSTLIDLISTSYPNSEILIGSVLPFAPGTDTGVNLNALNQVRDDFVDGIPNLLTTKNNKIGFYDTSQDIVDSDYFSNGFNLIRSGYTKEASNFATAINRVFPVKNQFTIPRTVRLRTPQASMLFDANGDQATIPYNALLSPGNESFAFGVWHYPTALPADSALRNIVRYSTTHPNGYGLGHIAASGNGGGLNFYLVSGSPIFNSSPGSYSFEALEINTWHRIVVVCDRSLLRAGLFINGQLVAWATISSAWNITETESTYFGLTGDVTFAAALGYTDGFFFAKGSRITLNDAMKFVEKDYYEGISFPGTTAIYNFSEGSGASSASQTYGLSDASLTATWLASGSVPKIVDEV